MVDPDDLPRDLDTLRARVGAGERFEYVFFWGHTPRADGSVGTECLSQWYPAPFEVGGLHYASAEHYMMWEKALLFADTEAQARVLMARSPAEAKKIGRAVRGFDEARWAARRSEAVVRGNVAKFEQHPDLRDVLLATEARVLVEASPRDRVWGIGLGVERGRAVGPEGWRGLNLLGFALMEARARLREAR
jgi:ribA/ribD-fused uncharacterized protein